jgi:hypothetical protein
MFAGTIVEAQPRHNADSLDVGLAMLRPPSGPNDPIQYHKTAVLYVLQCYGPLMCNEDRALLEKVVGFHPIVQQATKSVSHLISQEGAR